MAAQSRDGNSCHDAAGSKKTDSPSAQADSQQEILISLPFLFLASHGQSDADHKNFQKFPYRRSIFLQYKVRAEKESAARTHLDN